jgi:hypothetical protein
MAAPTTIEDGIPRALDVLASMLQELQQGEKLWAEMDAVEEAAWSLEWTQLMSGYLPRLDREHQSGQMSAEQSKRFRRLRKALRQALPTIERLELTPPPIPLDRS